MRFTAMPSPTMLRVAVTANTRVGSGRENPSDRPSAVAQTASSTAEASRIIQARAGVERFSWR